MGFANRAVGAGLVVAEAPRKSDLRQVGFAGTGGHAGGLSGSDLSVCVEPDITRRGSHVYVAARDEPPTAGIHAPYALHSRRDF